MKTKTKITIGLGALLTIIGTIIMSSSIFLTKLSGDPGAKTHNNFMSIYYAKAMLNSVDDIKTANTFLIMKGKNDSIYKVEYFLRLYENAMREFKKNIKAQEKNISANGDKELVKNLNSNFNNYIDLSNKVKNDTVETGAIYLPQIFGLYQNVKNMINKMIDQNTKTLEQKNANANNDSRRMVMIMSIVAAMSISATMFYLLYFPGILTSKINSGMKNFNRIMQN